MTEILNQLPNGGAVIAIIAVVILFLKKEERSEGVIKETVSMFTAEIVASRKEYREHVNEIMRMGLDAHHETREAIRELSQALVEMRSGGTGPKGRS